MKKYLILRYDAIAYIFSFAGMDEHLINSDFGNKMCKVKQVQPNLFRVTLDNVFAGYLRRDGDGWMLEEYSKEELTAEAVQLIGDKIDGLPWQLMQ